MSRSRVVVILVTFAVVIVAFLLARQWNDPSAASRIVNVVDLRQCVSEEGFYPIAMPAVDSLAAFYIAHRGRPIVEVIVAPDAAAAERFSDGSDAGQPSRLSNVLWIPNSYDVVGAQDVVDECVRALGGAAERSP